MKAEDRAARGEGVPGCPHGDLPRRSFLGLLGAAVTAPFVPVPAPLLQAVPFGISPLAALQAELDAEFLYGRHWRVEDVARAYCVPAGLINGTPRLFP